LNLAQSFQLFGTAVFVAGSAIVAFALLRLANRTRQLPEFLLGVGILGTAVLGYGLLICDQIIRMGIAQSGGGIGTSMVVLQGAGKILHNVGVSAFLLFVIQVFHRRDRWAHVLAAGLLAVLWGGLAWGAIFDQSFRVVAVLRPAWWIEYSIIWTYQGWLCIEAIRYWTIMRRRSRLGLADPMLTNRFALWGAASTFSLIAIWTASSPILVMDQPEALASIMPVVYYGTSLAGLASVTCSYLTFLPPAWYSRRVAARAARQRA
jgi:hypothetical protein